MKRLYGGCTDPLATLSADHESGGIIITSAPAQRGREQPAQGNRHASVAPISSEACRRACSRDTGSVLNPPPYKLYLFSLCLSLNLLFPPSQVHIR